MTRLSAAIRRSRCSLPGRHDDGGVRCARTSEDGDLRRPWIETMNASAGEGRTGAGEGPSAGDLSRCHSGMAPVTKTRPHCYPDRLDDRSFVRLSNPFQKPSRRRSRREQAGTTSTDGPDLKDDDPIHDQLGMTSSPRDSQGRRVRMTGRMDGTSRGDRRRRRRTAGSYPGTQRGERAGRESGNGRCG